MSADGLDPDAAETFSSPIAVVNGSATILGDFLFTTPGLVSVYADNGVLSANSITVSGDNYIHADTRPAPTIVGTISAGSMNFSTGGDLIIDAHLVSDAGIGLSAPGLIDVEDVTSNDGAIDMQAGSSLDAGNLLAAGGIQLDSGATLTALNGSAGGGFEATAAAGSMSLGNIDANSFLVLNAAGSITTGNLDGGTFVFLNATAGSILAGSVTGGASVDLEATGGITAGDLLAISDFAYASAGNGPLVVGNVDAATFIHLLSPLGSITAGNLGSGTAISLEADGDIDFGDANAGTELDFDTAGAVTGGNIVAGIHAGGQAGGA